MLPMTKLDDDIQFLKNVGPARAKDFARLGIKTVRDLLFTFPRDLKDRTRVYSISDAPENADISVAVRLERIRERISRQRKSFLTASARDETGWMEAVWFHTPWMAAKLRPRIGTRILFYGRGTREFNTFKMVNPQCEFLETISEAENDDSVGKTDSLHVGRIVPEYPCTGHLNQNAWRRVMNTAIEAGLSQVQELYPDAYLQKRGFLTRQAAIKAMHFPAGEEEGLRAKERLSWDEALLLELSILSARRHLLTDRPGRSFSITPTIDYRIRKLFPFQFTAAQDKAVEEIAADMENPLPMHRLLQGDVGCGKTAVALYACLAAIANGAQACVMAPIGLLARQHYETINRLLASSGKNRVQTALLVSKLKPSEKQGILDNLKNGAIQLLIATHAAIAERVEFKDLGLVIIDEQHKFGVQQRTALINKGIRPDTLVMTATPIPRSLALTVFGDLEVTTIKGLPPGRKGITTKAVGTGQSD